MLKNVEFVNHMKHHLELKRLIGDSWKYHTTCQHCHRQFPTPIQLQCHMESVHTSQEPCTVCKICELSFVSLGLDQQAQCHCQYLSIFN